MEQLASFGAWVRRRRKALDLTQVALAQRVGVAPVTIQKIEADERRPSLQVAALLAEQLHIPGVERAAFLAAARGERAPDRLGDPSAALGVGHSRLPTRLSSFIGRAREQAELAALLAQPDVRLLTLTGAGGSGKTSLAIRAAQTQAGEYRDGACFVDLAPVSDAAQVALAIAQSLGIPQAAAIAPREQLRSWLRDRQLLLILDNMEQVIDAAVLVLELVQAAPELYVLVTSRVPLRVTGEREYPVAPLGADAALLFMERARNVRPGIVLDGEASSVIQAICEKLDGLPLAIELAAAQIRVFAVRQLLEQLHTAALPRLVGGARDLPARQQTIRATIDWSYRLLAPAEQVLFARVGVFVGGWTLEAVEAIDVAPLSSAAPSPALQRTARGYDRALARARGSRARTGAGQTWHSTLYIAGDSS
jgi:predicted ATPase/DNA-binding XRE family transcriptional regulator